MNLDKSWISQARAQAEEPGRLEFSDQEHVLRFLKRAEQCKTTDALEDYKKLISMRYKHTEWVRERRENSAAYDFESDTPGM